MNDLIAQAAQVQADLQKAQEEILATNVEGQAGNGLVKVTMTGGAEITDIKIKPEAVDADDIESLQDLILAAYRDAHNQAGKLAEEKIAPLTGGAMGGGAPQGGAPQAGPGEIPFGGII